MKKALLIYNPKSGKNKTNPPIYKYKEILETYDYKLDVIATEYKNHAKNIIEKVDFYDIVFSLGGDGTLNEIITGNFHRKEKLKICPLPYGTCNDVASMLGYTNDNEKNIKMALNGEYHDLDIGTINNTPFIYVVGVGKFLNIPYETTRESKSKNGYLSYIKNGLNEILNQMKRYDATITIDGKTLNDKYSIIIISNSNHIAGIKNFYKNVCLNDEKMEVLLCKAKNIKELLIDFICFLTGTPTKNVISIKGHEIDIKFQELPEKNWCIDGEKLEEKNNEFTIKTSGKMKVLTPKMKKKCLFNDNF